ncbi:hypothetical protein EKL85_21505 [Salmonella enterica subsp. enterica serovar Give]|nr:hypothetical protein [Salmonella enterica subsp. enterica serovar Give]ECA4141858.1 hypothetical protein [Salmonella enterica subsp. enterica serovar Give]
MAAKSSWLRSPRLNTLIVSVYIVMMAKADALIQAADSLWSGLIAGLFFNILFPLLLFRFWYRCIRQQIKDHRVLPVFRLLGRLLAVTYCGRFMSSLVPGPEAFPCLYVLLTITLAVAQLIFISYYGWQLFRVARNWHDS